MKSKTNKINAGLNLLSNRWNYKDYTHMYITFEYYSKGKYIFNAKYIYHTNIANRPL